MPEDGITQRTSGTYWREKSMYFGAKIMGMPRASGRQPRKGPPFINHAPYRADA